MAKTAPQENDSASHLRARKLSPPPKVAPGAWTLPQLREHLQWAMDVELYTIPYYMAALYSIKDPASEPARVVRSVVHQEMFHMQSAANLANAFGTDLVVQAPRYGGDIPHLDFALDQVDPRKDYSPYSTSIGPFDVERLNTMCIIEYPDWHHGDRAAPSGSTTEYGSIGELYGAIRAGIEELRSDIRGDHRQVDYFARFYPDLDHPTITLAGADGLPQALGLIDAIVSQGEGKARKQDFVPASYQNKADDLQPSWDHFEKFTYLRNQPLPEVHRLTIGNDAGKRAQEDTLRNFGELLAQLNALFHGERIDSFGPLMFTIGAGIAACWQNGTLPVFCAAEDNQGGES